MEQRYNQTTDLFLDEPVVYAGFWERFGAAFLDGLILAVAGYVIGLILPEAEGDFYAINFSSLLV